MIYSIHASFLASILFCSINFSSTVDIIPSMALLIYGIIPFRNSTRIRSVLDDGTTIHKMKLQRLYCVLASDLIFCTNMLQDSTVTLIIFISYNFS